MIRKKQRRKKAERLFLKNFSLLFFFLVIPVTACSGRSSVYRTLTIRDRTLRVEIADTDALRRKGLMFRKKLKQGYGMLFVFPRERKLSFWMKNTSLPLDLAYIDRNGEIREIHPLRPYSLEPVRSRRSMLYALEVPRGWFAAKGITAGARVEFSFEATGK